MVRKPERTYIQAILSCQHLAQLVDGWWLVNSYLSK